PTPLCSCVSAAGGGNETLSARAGWAWLWGRSFPDPSDTLPRLRFRSAGAETNQGAQGEAGLGFREVRVTGRHTPTPRRRAHSASRAQPRETRRPVPTRVFGQNGRSESVRNLRPAGLDRASKVPIHPTDQPSDSFHTLQSHTPRLQRMHFACNAWLTRV